MDKDTQLLVNYFEDLADRFADYMTDLAFAKEEQSKSKIYLLILALLLKFQDEAKIWARANFPKIYRDARNRANSYIRKDSLREWDAEDEAAVLFLISEFEKHIEKAVTGVQGDAVRNRRGTLLLALLPLWMVKLLKDGKSIPADKLAQTKSEVRKRFRQGLVPLIGKNGNTYHYGLDYYVGLVAEQTKHLGYAKAGINAARSNNIDLVRVSPNPSTIGDYCDAYRGRVFSLSGNDPNFYPITALPGGTCPFHPHCRHFLIPFDGNDNFPPLEPRFAQLAMSGESNPNVFQRMWVGK